MIVQFAIMGRLLTFAALGSASAGLFSLVAGTSSHQKRPTYCFPAGVSATDTGGVGCQAGLSGKLEKVCTPEEVEECRIFLRNAEIPRWRSLDGEDLPGAPGIALNGVRDAQPGSRWLGDVSDGARRGFFCPECRRTGKRSQVRGAGGAAFGTFSALSIAAVYCEADAFWDEDGKHHFHDHCFAPPVPEQYRCSLGHTFSLPVSWVAPECWCGWKWGQR